MRFSRSAFTACVAGFALTVAAPGASQPASAQTIAEFAIPTANSQPESIASGPDGALWFTNVGSDRIGRITTGGVVTEFALSATNSQPTGIAAGPDGNMWFTEVFNANKIGRITPAGVITEFSIPTPSSYPTSIVAGPDGAMWFTEVLGDRIGRITMAGVITEFVVGGNPVGIAAGSDGNLWFTRSSANKIGRLTPTGVLTDFTVTSNGSNYIAAGSDGALWFTWGSAHVSRITTAGVSTDFLVPNNAFNIHGIAAGPDGALWFTQPQGGRIGRVTTAGVFSSFDIPNGGGNRPLGIATGPDGNLWFTESNAGRIGRLTPPGSGPTAIVSAILPASRSVVAGSAATAFATVINSGTGTGVACGLSISDALPVSFTYFTTDSATNAITGAANAPTAIPVGAAQSFLFSMRPASALNPMEVPIVAKCSNSAAAPTVIGLNTLLFSSSNSPVPDIVALVATAGNNGIVDIAGAGGAGAFAVASVNVGAGGTITVSAEGSVASLPFTLALCETNPGTGACTSAVGSTVTTGIAPNATPTFAIFLQGTGNVPFDPATNRVFVRFRESGGTVRGATSVAVRTQ